jgi:large subunit ribosomal protein L22
MYTFEPNKRHAKAWGTNLRISKKKAKTICSVIRKKKLSQVKRLLADLKNKKRSLNGKYHTKAVVEILKLLESCEKNAEFKGLDKDLLFVHASAHQGTIRRRRRRKAAFGSRMKSTNVEIILIESGKKQREKKTKPEKKRESKMEKELKDVIKREKEIIKHEEKLEKNAEKLKSGQVSE